MNLPYMVLNNLHTEVNNELKIWPLKIETNLKLTDLMHKIMIERDILQISNICFYNGVSRTRGKNMNYNHIERIVRNKIFK